jgi:subtilisin family serine protease
VVAAAGNESGNGGGSSGPVYPAAYEEVIAVAGIDQQEHHVPTSVAGPHVDVAAPGFSIDGPMPRGGGYAQFKAGGTSFAAGYVSGLAALIRAQDPQLTPGQVARRITATADHPPEGRNDQVGYGVINPYRALAAVTGGSTKPPNAGLLDRPERPVDPLAGTKRTAAILTGALLALTLLFVTGAWLMRRARSIRPDATPRFPRHRRPGPLAFTPNRAT